MTSTNFSVDKTGKVTAKSGTIGGYNISENDFTAELYTDYDYTNEDLVKLQQYLTDQITLTDQEKERLDYYKDGIIDSRDYMMIRNVINGVSGVNNSNRGKITIQRKNHMKTISVEDGFDNEVVAIGVTGIKTNNLEAKQINSATVKKQSVLWSGAWYMHAGQVAELSENISDQMNGIVLVWSSYSDGNAVDSNFNFTFVPKTYIELKEGYGVTCIIAGTPFSPMGCKYVYISDDHITGNDNNTSSGSQNGITYNNNSFVLRYVIGV